MTKEDQILEILHEHTKLLNTCILTLNEHSKEIAILSKRVDTLSERVDGLSGKVDTLSERVDTLSKKVAELSEIVTEHTYILLDHSERLDKIEKRLCTLEEKFDNMHQILILLEDDFSNKSAILFDCHSISQEHFGKTDKDIEDLQTVSKNHSRRLISLELDSQKHTKQLEHLSSSK